MTRNPGTWPWPLTRRYYIQLRWRGFCLFKSCKIFKINDNWPRIRTLSSKSSLIKFWFWLSWHEIPSLLYENDKFILKNLTNHQLKMLCNGSFLNVTNKWNIHTIWKLSFGYFWDGLIQFPMILGRIKTTVSGWMVETRLREKRRARWTERGKTRGTVHSRKRPSVRFSAGYGRLFLWQT